MKLHRYSIFHGAHNERYPPLLSGYAIAVGDIVDDSRVGGDTAIVVIRERDGRSYRVELWHRNGGNPTDTMGPRGIATFQEAVDAAFSFAEEWIENNGG
jgi:hypothetical protein